MAVKPKKPASALPRRHDVVGDTAVVVEDKVTADVSLLAKVQPEDRASYAAEVERIRKIRKPFGAQTQKLALPERPGYKRHWFNDVAGRVDEAESNGWAHLKDKDSKPLKRVVGTGRDNKALHAYAMELPKVFWDEDMAARHAAAQARIDEIKTSPIRSKSGQAQKSDTNKFYSPHEDDGPIKVIQPTG